MYKRFILSLAVAICLTPSGYSGGKEEGGRGGASKSGLKSYLAKFPGYCGFRALSVTSAGAPDRVVVCFNRIPAKGEATNPENYLIDDGAFPVQSAVRHKRIVVLELESPLPAGEKHELHMFGLTDLFGHPLADSEEVFDYVEIPGDTELWFRSDRKVVKDSENNVYAWVDQSGNGHLLWTSPGDWKKPPVYTENAVNSLPALLFEDNLMILPQVSALETDEISWFVVFRSDHPDIDQQILANSYARGAGSGSKNFWGTMIFGDSVAAYSRSGDRWNNLVKLVYPAALDTEWHFLSARWNSDDSLKADMDALGELAAGGADAVPRKHLFFMLGKSLPHPRQDGLKGALAEVLVYKRALTDEERESVCDYLSGKYFNSDSDGDGLHDEWELEHFGNLDQGPEDDFDNDGLTNLEEYELGTDPANSDTDGDGMPDAWEVQHGFDPLLDDSGGDADSDGLSNLGEYQAQTDPNHPDTDGDQIKDGAEVSEGFDPLDKDDPGLLDLTVVFPAEGTTIE